MNSHIDYEFKWQTLARGLQYALLSSGRSERFCHAQRMINQAMTLFHRIQYSSSAQTSKSYIKYKYVPHIRYVLTSHSPPYQWTDNTDLGMTHGRTQREEGSRSQDKKKSPSSWGRESWSWTFSYRILRKWFCCGLGQLLCAAI